MFFRRGVSDDDWLEVKLWLFSIGAFLALLGMGLRNDWFIAGAALFLAAGLGLRFIDRPGREGTARDEGPSEEPSE